MTGTFLQDSWNVYEVLILSLCVATIVLYFYRLIHSSRLSKQLHNEPTKFHNLQYAVLWDEVCQCVIDPPTAHST